MSTDNERCIEGHTAQERTQLIDVFYCISAVIWHKCPSNSDGTVTWLIRLSVISYQGKRSVINGFRNHRQAEELKRIFFFAEIRKFLYSVNCGFPRLLSPYHTTLIFHSAGWRETASRVAGLQFLAHLLLLMLLYCSRRLWLLPYGLNTVPHSCSYASRTGHCAAQLKYICDEGADRSLGWRDGKEA